MNLRQVAIIEIAKIYHTIRHKCNNLSKNYGIKFNYLYGDPVIPKKTHWGRTKAETIVRNIFSPNSIELSIQDL